MRRLIPLAAVVLLAGCSTLTDLMEEVGIDPSKATAIEDKTLGHAVKPLPIYCKAPGSIRSGLRDRAWGRPEAKGAKIGVWCPGDPPLTLGP